MPEQAKPKLRSSSPLVFSVRPCTASYAELGVTTNFSFLRGASHANELIARAAELGYRAIAATDLNTLAGAVRMHTAAKEAGLKLLVGARLEFSDHPPLRVWPMDRPAYGRLCRLLTLGKRRTTKAECDLSIADFLQHSDGMHAAVVPENSTGKNPPPYSLSECREREKIIRQLRDLKDILGNRFSLMATCAYEWDDQTRLEKLIAWSRSCGVPLLASNDVHYHAPSRRRLQDLLTCIRHGCTIHEAGLRLFPNGERYLKSPVQMQAIFSRHPQAIRRGLEIAGQCSFSLDELRYEYPRELAPAGQTPLQYLAKLAWIGAAERYPAGIPDKVRSLIKRELQLIENLKIEAYFLTVYDLVRFARGRGILCQGRGSAANSAVCYCIGVTSVDPARIDVLFERFVSAARDEPPDIDIDFEHERREEVIQYIYEKYGRDRAGMTAEVITYRGRSAVRDVGKAMGLGLDMVDQMAKRLDWWDRGTLTPQKLREVGLDPNDPTVWRVVELSAELLGFPRHLGQHVGGMVMTSGFLSEMVPIENAVMPDRTVIEWDKQDIDDLGILKVDVLALGMLTCLSKAMTLINCGEGTEAPRHGSPKENLPDEVEIIQSRNSSPPCLSPLSPSWLRAFVPSCLSSPDLSAIPAEDPVVYKMISDADTIGVFQIESRAQMTMLPRLKPDKFYDLVIEVAIVRPGPIQGDMVHPYLRRRNGEEAVSYPSPELEEVLKKTLGVPLFQEQAMRLAMVGAGFSAEEADQLRRAMAAWRRSGAIEEFHKKIVEGMLRNGYSAQYAEQCYKQLRGFGEYGFPESHAASFALLVYASSWIKRYHPAAFCCALLNSQPMGFYAPAQIVRDAQMHSVSVLPVDVNHSNWDCILDVSGDKGKMPDDVPVKWDWGRDGPAVRLGFRMIGGCREAHAEQITAARNSIGRFRSVSHFRASTALPSHALRRLAEADAFSSLGISRRQALWEVMKYRDDEMPLFEQIDNRDEAVTLPRMTESQEVTADYHSAGLSLKQHPMSLLRPRLERMGIITADTLSRTDQGRWVCVAGIVLIRQRPGTASGIVFETLEDETGVVNLIIRPAIFDRYRPAARHAILVRAEGYVERQGQVIHVMTLRLEDLSEMLNCQTRSRDFH